MNDYDKLGMLKAQIADLVRQEGELKARILREQGHGRFDGDFYTVTVFQQERSTLDLAAVRRKLSRQFLQAHTRYSVVDVFKVTARQREVA